MKVADPSVWQQDEVQAWLRAHATSDPVAVSLGGSPFADGPTSAQLAQQLAGWQKAKSKLPTYFEREGVAYPPSLSMEQCSSEETARWKAESLRGNSLVDLTAGFGVDAYFLGEGFETLHVIEQQPQLAELAEHNLAVLRKSGFQVACTTSEKFLEAVDERFDWAYVDPARRGGDGGRVFRLQDCSPDVVGLLPLLESRANNILIKASPLLDIQQGIQELGGVTEVVVLAVRNEVKELLFYVQAEKTDDPPIRAVNLGAKGKEELLFRRSEEAVAQAPLGPLGTWLLEPNASLMKAGGFKVVAQRLGLKKLHANTHLYTTEEDVSGFPGRRFRVIGECTPQKKSVRKLLTEPKAMVGTRNFPLSAPQLQKKLGLADGGSHYVMGFTDFENQKKVAVLEPVQG